MSFNSRMGVAILLALSLFVCSGSANGIPKFEDIAVESIESLASRSLLEDGSYGSYGSYAAAGTYDYGYYAPSPSYGYGGYAPEPVYYSPITPYGTPAPAYYYAAPPTAEPGSYTPSAPTYYYTVPAPAPGGYAPVEPTYYYTVPAPAGYAPVEPTYYTVATPAPAGYAPVEPTYYTVATPAPAGYAPSVPTYYTVPVAVTAYGEYAPSAPTYYYTVSAPAPAGYAAPTPAYYYTVPAAAPAGYASTAPTYYYTAPSVGGYAAATPVYYYSVPTVGGYASTAPTYYAAPAPSTGCPACPVCPADTLSTAGRRLSAQAQAIAPVTATALPAPAGTCYCSYDLEWKSWAISLKTCRDSLYTRCDTDSRLDCKWLDEYFNPGSSSGFMKAHEKDISEYLYQDCPPAAPCSCAALSFDKRDDGSAVYACCRDLAIWAQVPHSGISQKEVDSFCKAGSSEHVAAWVKHSLWHSTCEEQRPVYHATRPIEAKVVENMEAAVAPKETLAAVVGPQIQYVRPAGPPSSIAPPVLVAGVVGLCAFVAVFGGLLGFHYARNVQQ